MKFSAYQDIASLADDDIFCVGQKQADGTYKFKNILVADALSGHDEFEEYATLGDFPATGSADVIYVALDTNKLYRWSGSTYVQMSPSEVTSVNGRTGAVTGLAELDFDNTFTEDNLFVKPVTIEGTIKVGLGAGSIATNIAMGIEALMFNTTGASMMAFGYQALRNNTTGTYNTAFGYGALKLNTTGVLNTGIGAQALFKNTTGSYNLGVGVEALQNNTTGSNNTAVGPYDAMFSNTTGASNTALGYAVMYFNDSGSLNTALGRDALYNNIIGNNNVAVGYAAAQLGTGSDNTNIGTIAGRDNVTGIRNVNLGSNAGKLSLGSRNINIGYNANSEVLGGSDQLNIGDTYFGNMGTWTDVGTVYTAFKIKITDTASSASSLLLDAQIGAVSKFKVDKFGNTTAVGNLTLNRGIITADNPSLNITEEWNNGAVLFTGMRYNVTNTASVAGSLFIQLQENSVPKWQVTTDGDMVARNGGFNGDVTVFDTLTVNTIKIWLGNSSVATNIGVGVNTLNSITTGNNNTAVGYQAMRDTTTGNYNTAFGYFTLLVNTTGVNNTALGAQALFKNTTGSYNLAIGVESLDNNLTGDFNTAVGPYDTLYSNTTGFNNTAVGYAAMFSNTTGNINTAVGRDALYNNISGIDNAAFGYRAGHLGTGSENTNIGTRAGRDNVSGNQNVNVGASAGRNSLGSNNIVIGYAIDTENLSGNSQLNIGNTYFGNMGVWNDAGTTFTAFKVNVTDTASAALSLLMDLKASTVSKYQVFKDGATVQSGSVTASIAALGSAGSVFLTHTAGLIQSRTAAQVLSDIGAAPATGSTSYIQNTAVQQAGSTFNISGAGVIGGTLTVSTAGSTFAGGGSGTPAAIFGNTTGTSVIRIRGGAGSSRAIFLSTGDTTRMEVILDNVAEGGSNAGSNFQIRRYSDAGSLLATGLYIRRSDGQVGIGNSAPSFALDVTGTGRYTGAVQLDSTLAVTGVSTFTGLANHTNGITIGGGATLTKFLSASATIDFPSTAAQTSSTSDITVTGAAIGDRVLLGLDTAVIPGDSENVRWEAWVQAANTVRIRVKNMQAVSSFNPPSAIFTVDVFKTA